MADSGEERVLFDHVKEDGLRKSGVRMTMNKDAVVIEAYDYDTEDMRQYGFSREITTENFENMLTDLRKGIRTEIPIGPAIEYLSMRIIDGFVNINYNSIFGGSTPGGAPMYMGGHDKCSLGELVSA